mmetsp:Transcript_42867/g.91933  ORF Transcript_42867/g.91933 Transcript_42867/m.91933 type:complete len:613 (-) Transcript_42867:630-2468(-)
MEKSTTEEQQPLLVPGPKNQKAMDDLCTLMRNLIQISEFSLELQREQVRLSRLQLHSAVESDTRSEAAAALVVRGNNNSNNNTLRSARREATMESLPSGSSASPRTFPPQRMANNLKSAMKIDGPRTPSFDCLSEIAIATGKEGFASLTSADIVWDLQQPGPAMYADLSFSQCDSEIRIPGRHLSKASSGTIGSKGIRTRPQTGRLRHCLTMESFGPSTVVEDFSEPPAELSPTLMNGLFLTGMWPNSAATMHPWTYKAYRCLLVLSLIGCFLTNGFFAAVTLANDQRFSHYLRDTFAHGVASLMSVAALIKWTSLTKEFQKDGVAMGLLHDVVFRGSDLSACRRSFTMFSHSALGWVVFFVLLQIPGRHTSLDCSDSELALGSMTSACEGVHYFAYPFFLLALLLAWMILWVIRLLCNLHIVELRWFAENVAATLESDNAQNKEDLLFELDSVESKITRRFITASHGWVFTVATCVSAVGVVWLAGLGFLVTTGISSLHTLDVIEVVALLFLMTCTMGWSFLPFAKVAEVHEYDLLRTLNKPQILFRAMPLFGQQMLPHLHTLEWGFKIGQTIINMRLVVNVLGAVAITCITTIGAAVIATMSGSTATAGL